MDPFLERISASWPPSRWTDQRVLVACSGGPDSMALAAALAQLQPHRPRLEVAHFHHGLRGATADRDLAQVEAWCRSTGLPFHAGQAEEGEVQQASLGEGTESAARQLRYRFLIRTAESRGCRYLVTGHTLDDQVETVLHHILRGTALSGLAGIPRLRRASAAVTIVRPLLDLSRQEVESFLERTGVQACHDEHNDTDQFLRNRLRNELLPYLEQQFAPSLRSALVRLSRVAAEAQEALRQVADELLDQCLLDRFEHQTTLGCEPLRGRAIHMRRELFVRLWQRQNWPQQAMTLDHWQRLAEMAGDEPVTLSETFPGSIQVERQAFLLRLVRREAT